MKVDLIDISIKDLRDFTLYSDQYLSMNFRNFSASSLKLRLQFLIFENKFKSFDSFLDYYKKDELLQQKIISNIIPRASELLRDASCFECFFNLMQQTLQKEIIEICLFEFGNYSETISLIIVLNSKGYLNKARITIIDLTSGKGLPDFYKFTQKDIDTGEINYAALNSKQNFVDFFSMTESGYEYLVPPSAQICHKKISEITSAEIKFDVIISRNLTLHYNFRAHQNIFLTYVNFLEKNGLLFAGTNEGFDWCSGIEQLIKPNKTKPFYIKK